MLFANAWKLITRGSLVAAAGCWLASQSACSNPPSGRSVSPGPKPVLSRESAAEKAAMLANEQCQKQYQKRPFKADQHAAILEHGTYRWGGLDVGGPKGFSASVTFRQDGSDPRVEIYFSSDRVIVRKIPLPGPAKNSGL